MSLFSTFGQKVNGLLGSDAFFDRLAQAQAFEHGDPRTAAWIGAQIRNGRGGVPSGVDGSPMGAADPRALSGPPMPDTGAAIHALGRASFRPLTPMPLDQQWTLAGDPHAPPIRFGVGADRSMLTNPGPRQRHSWKIA